MTRTILLLLCSLTGLFGAGQFLATQPGEVLTSPRPAADSTPLLFPFVTSAAGFDTAITLSNTSLDTLGSAPAGGVCGLDFYGSNAPGRRSTSTIAAGKQITIRLSEAAPGFRGYLIATCRFPLARGSARVSSQADNLAYAEDARVINLPRRTAGPRALLFPYASNQGGTDTGITISNTSSDPFGAGPSSGACLLTFHDGTGKYPAVITGLIAPGTTYSNFLSSVAPGFQGYVAVRCDFSGAEGLAFVSDPGARKAIGVETPEAVSGPRDSVVRPLLFSSVSSAPGQDTQMAVANTSDDGLGSTPLAGSCTLHFYGSSAPPPVSTGEIAPGAMWTGLASAIAPNFQGYAVAACTFPHARGRAYVAAAGFQGDGDSAPVEVMVHPRSRAASSLLFSAVSARNSEDTSFVVSNTSLDPFGRAGHAGVCKVSYFGDVEGGSDSPAPQTSKPIPPGGQLTFSLAAGNPAQGIAATPGFHGYVQIDCGFSEARGLATFTGRQAGPPLTCSANVGTPPVVRAEGMTELVGDILVTCTGGQALAAGTVIPTVDFTVSLGTSITSRVSGSASEALLLVDEPGSGLPPAAPGFGPAAPQSLCTSSCVQYAANVVAGNSVVQVASSSPSSAVAAPNIFQGQVSGSQVTFHGIPMLPPGPGGSRYFRITNVRANVAALSGAFELVASVSLASSGGIPLSGGSQIAAFVQTGLLTSLRNSANTGALVAGGTAFPQCTGLGAPMPVGLVRFGEAYGYAFKTRATGSQNIPGAAYPGSESGFLLAAANAGSADYGTRLKAVFHGIPAGVRIFVSTTNVASTSAATTSSSAALYAVLVQSESVVDNPSPPAVTATTSVNNGATALAELTVAGGVATAVWEVVNTNPLVLESLDFGVWIQYTSNVPAVGAAMVNLSFAPTSGSTIPSFADTSTGQGVFGIAVCPSAMFSEYPTLTAASNPLAITSGPDGALWFTELIGKIGRVTTAGSITEFQIPSGSGSVGITAGPDGALWFIESSKIGRITTAGAIMEFPIPSPSSQPEGITVGPDGALWFTEFSSGKIGRITTAGAVTETTVPGSPSGIATGPDGALWFTEQDGNRIARITTGGALTEYPVLTAPRSLPEFITAGPDGAMWFTESGAAKIGRITTAGAITEFSTLPFTQPAGVATGPDGAVWFTDANVGGVGRITPDGVVTEYALPEANIAPVGIVTGPDGALWVPDHVSGIVRIALRSAVSCTYSLPPTSAAFTSNGGNGSAMVRAAAGCTWTAASPFPWITITSGGTGSGDGTVSFTVAANPSASSRFAILTIAGQDFTVTESGTSVTAVCAGSVGSPAQAALEGRTELLADFVLNCAGLTGTVKADVTLSLNTNVTNMITNGATDAALSINGSFVKNGAVAGYNSLFWSGLSVTPAADGTASLRISQVRADASLLATLGSFQPTAITGQIGVNALTPLPVTAAVQTMAIASPTLQFTRNPANPPAGGAQTTIPVVYQEVSPAVFHAGVTRLRTVLTNVPTTVQVYAPVFPTEGASRAQLFSADANGQGGSPVNGTQMGGVAVQQLVVAGGTATATWLVEAVDAAQIDTYTFPLLLLNAGASDLTQILVQGSLAPVSIVSSASTSAPVPRYRDFSVPQALVNLRITTSIQTQPRAAVSPGGFVPAKAPVSVGSNITFVNQVVNDTTNNNQTATNVVVRDNLPTGLSFISCTASGGGACSTSGGQVQVTYASLGPGQSATVMVTAGIDPTLAPGTVITNSASAASDEANLDLPAGTASSSIIVLVGSPATVGVTPSQGGGSTQNFTFQFSHPSGYQYLGVVNVLFNLGIDGRSACYLAYIVPSNTLVLVDDAGDAGGPFAGTVVLGDSSTIQNSQCAVTLVSAVGSGTTLTLTLGIAFKQSFGGNRVAFVAARDQGSGNTNWQPLGVWQVPMPPAGSLGVGGVALPSAGSQAFTFTYTDTKGTGDFGIANVLFNGALDGRKACYVAFVVSTSTLILVDDGGDAGGPYAGSTALNGGSGSVQNGQCTITANGSRVNFAANTLMLTLSISFTPAFRGNQIVFAAVRDQSQNNTGWQAVGTWTVQ